MIIILNLLNCLKVTVYTRRENTRGTSRLHSLRRWRQKDHQNGIYSSLTFCFPLNFCLEIIVLSGKSLISIHRTYFCPCTFHVRRLACIKWFLLPQSLLLHMYSLYVRYFKWYQLVYDFVETSIIFIVLKVSTIISSCLLYFDFPGQRCSPVLSQRSNDSVRVFTRPQKPSESCCHVSCVVQKPKEGNKWAQWFSTSILLFRIEEKFLVLLRIVLNFVPPHVLLVVSESRLSSFI